MPEKNKEVQKSEDLLTEFQSARNEWASQAAEDNEFRNGKQWSKKMITALRKRAQEPLVVNVIHPAVEQAKAMLTSNTPRFQSTAREDSDNRTGRMFSDLMTYIWGISNGTMELKQSIDDYYVKGMGCMMAYTDPNADYGKGEVLIRSIDPLNLYIDPNAKDPFCSDASHIVFAKLYTESHLLQAYPQYKEAIQSASEQKISDDQYDIRHGLEGQQTSQYTGDHMSRYDRTLEVIERYTKVRMPYMRVFDTTNGQEKIMKREEFMKYIEQPAFIITNPDLSEQVITDQKAVDQAMKQYEETGGIFHQEMNPMTQKPETVAGVEDEQSIPNSTTIMELASIKDIISRKQILVNNITIDHIKQICSVGGVLMYDSVIPIEHYPIITFMNTHNRNPFPISDVRLVRGLQEYINKLRSLIVAHASSSTNVKLLIPRGSVNKKDIEEAWAKAGTGVIEFDPELGQPIIASPIPLPNELYKNESDAKADIERILGIYALMQGQAEGAPQTYKGTVALDEYGQRRIKSKKDDIEAGLNQLGKVIVQLIQYVYTGQKIIRLLQPNNSPKQMTINQPIYDTISGELIEKLNDVTVGKYDIIVVSGSTLPSNRWARFEYYMTLFKNGIIDNIEVLKQTDVADTEGVLNRFDERVKMQGQIQQLGKQVKDLSGDLQTARREVVHAREKAELEKFKGNLKKSSDKADMTTQLYKSRTGDELKKLQKAVAVVERQTNSQREG